MGKGFLFEARQKRFTVYEEHFFVDLVFFNRLLRRYVLLDLKIGRIARPDLGQVRGRQSWLQPPFQAAFCVATGRIEST
jgi:hypothetical protein